MPSFFKNIKKLFTKPDRVTNNNTAPVRKSAPAAKATTKKADNSIKQNPFMDSHRAKSINATIIPESEHNIAYRDIDRNAARIVKDLERANYESYLVGGCVRDLLLHKKPKDFDVTTSAHPEQAHKVFSRSRLIGRRFKLLHVRFGRDIIEVATFRAAHDNAQEQAHSKQATSGMILRDNVYGTIDQDAIRRDFTINALYLDLNTRNIYDFTNGYQDIFDKKIRMIGDPNERYREDPVRMLRAIRFAAKLDFDIEQETAKPIKELAPMLFDIAPARLFDEVLKLLQSGHGNESLTLLREYNLLETILPQTAQALDNGYDFANELIFNALENTDRRLKQRKSVSPGFLYAVLLWPSVQHKLNDILSQKRIAPLTALHEAASQVISLQVKNTSIPKRFSTNIKEIWELQLKLTRRPGSKAEQLVEHPRFRSAYDLLVLREKSGEKLDGISQWWTQYQSADDKQKETLVNELNSKAPVKTTKKHTEKPTKRAPKKASFEKFDVVEQRKAEPKIRTTQAQTSSVDKPSLTDSSTSQNQQAVESTAKPARKRAPKKEQKPVSVSNESSIKQDENSQAPAPSIKAEEPQSNPSTQTVARKKPRRSRAKNDPRNK